MGRGCSRESSHISLKTRRGQPCRFPGRCPGPKVGRSSLGSQSSKQSGVLEAEGEGRERSSQDQITQATLTAEGSWNLFSA